MYHSTLYPQLLVSEESARAELDSASLSKPFVRGRKGLSAERFKADLFRELGRWSDAVPPEQTAFALGSITAADVLPPLVGLENGRDMLDYNVRLRDRLDGELVNELAMTLRAKALEMHWEQIGAHSYAAVIGSGVAVCIEVTPGSEYLYLRYANALAEELHNAHGAVQLPRSRLFLQSALYERFDYLLNEVRQRTWSWLFG